MKKILLTLMVCILLSSVVFAAGQSSSGSQGIHEPGTGIANPDLKEAGQGTGQGLVAQLETFTNSAGDEVQLTLAEQTRLRVRDVEAHTSMNITQEQVQNRTQLRVHLSNGINNAEIKVMPNTASETALARLRIRVCNESNNCTIQLKEVGTGNQTRAAYEVQAEKQAKVLGLFKTKMQVQAQIDAETGNVIQTKKPWWAFLASESEE